MRAKIRTPGFQSHFIAGVWIKCSLEFLTAFNLTLSEYKLVGKGYTGDHGENLNGGVSSSTFMACVRKVLHSFPENNKPPKADAGPDKELTLPVDSTTLDGSKSSDDQKIVFFLWEKTRCVSPSTFLCIQIFHFKQVTPPHLPCVHSWSQWAWQALPMTWIRQGFMFDWREVEFCLSMRNSFAFISRPDSHSEHGVAQRCFHSQQWSVVLVSVSWRDWPL